MSFFNFNHFVFYNEFLEISETKNSFSEILKQNNLIFAIKKDEITFSRGR